MKITIFFLVLFHSVLAVSQDPERTENNIYSATLCEGDALIFGNKSIKFKEIVSDSRCPKGVTCVWAGEVKVLVELYERGELKGEKIITGANISLAEFFNGQLLDVQRMVISPYPEVKRKILPEDYRLNLIVSEKIGSD